MKNEKTIIYRDNKKTLGQALKKVRIAKGYTEQYVALECQMDPANICEIEHGNKNVCYDTILRLLDVYGITVWEFFNDEMFKEGLARAGK